MRTGSHPLIFSCLSATSGAKVEEQEEKWRFERQASAPGPCAQEYAFICLVHEGPGPGPRGCQLSSLSVRKQSHWEVPGKEIRIWVLLRLCLESILESLEMGVSLARGSHQGHLDCPPQTVSDWERGLHVRLWAHCLLVLRYLCEEPPALSSPYRGVVRAAGNSKCGSNL